MTTKTKTDAAAKDITDILEIEIWDLVLKKIDKPDDLHALHNSCATFRNLLTRMRPTFLFPCVLPILMENGLANDDPISEPEKFDKKVLPLRCVCKSWKSGIDTHFQSTDYYRLSGYHEFPRFDPFFFRSLEDVDGFMTQMTTHTSNDNPFFTGLVKFSDLVLGSWRNEYFQFWEAVTTNLLPKFGQHILFSQIYNLTTIEGETGGYTLLAQIINQMPALRCLHVTTNFVEHAGLREQIVRTPIQYFKNLCTLVVENLPVVTINEILRAAGKCELKSLSVSYDRDEEADLFNASFWNFLPGLPSLVDVTLPKCSKLSSLLKLLNTNSSIEILDLTVSLGNAGENHEEEQISISRLFQALNLQGDRSTLRNLALDFHGRGRITRDLRLYLPLLEHLSITSGSTMVAVNSLDFAVEMRALRSLKIFACGNPFPTRKHRLDVIEYSGCVSNMTKSNIWTVLPQLENICFCETDCFEEHYEYFR